MSRLPWFRMHTEARIDKKLGSLSDAQHRVWFSLLCHAADQDVRGTIADDDRDLLAVECAGGDTELLEATLTRLVKLKIVELDEGYICFINFAERQYDKPSDMPERVRERVRKSRAVTRCNAQSPLEKRREEEIDKGLNALMAVETVDRMVAS